MSATEPVGAPKPAQRKARYHSTETVEWAQDSHRLLVDHGFACGTKVYRSRHQARWRCRHLIDVLCDLDLCKRWELREHVEERHGGWMWKLEHLEERDGERS